jgi:hypothetical protein
MNGRDDRAPDAVLVWAFLDGLMQAPPISGPEPELDPADESALDALGPDLVKRLLEEDVA